MENKNCQIEIPEEESEAFTSKQQSIDIDEKIVLWPPQYLELTAQN